MGHFTVAIFALSMSLSFDIEFGFLFEISSRLVVLIWTNKGGLLHKVKDLHLPLVDALLIEIRLAQVFDHALV